MAIQRQTLRFAVSEAQRFLNAASKLEAAAVWYKDAGRGWPTRCRQAADVRRASMDLTRALADLRSGR
jgi:hypothetical protein